MWKGTKNFKVKKIEILFKMRFSQIEKVSFGTFLS